MFCNFIQTFSLSWICFALHTSIDAIIHHVIHYTVCNYIWMKMVWLNGVDCTIDFSLEWTSYMVRFNNSSKCLICTKPKAHEDMSPLLCYVAMLSRWQRYMYTFLSHWSHTLKDVTGIATVYLTHSIRACLNLYTSSHIVNILQRLTAMYTVILQRATSNYSVLMCIKSKHLILAS